MVTVSMMPPDAHAGHHASDDRHSRAQLGLLEFECQMLNISETGQRLIAYCAAPGSATEAAFKRLAGLAPVPA